MEFSDYCDSTTSGRKEPDYHLSKDSFKRHVIFNVLKQSVDHLKVLGSALPFNSFDWSLVQEDYIQKLHVYTGKSSLLYPKYHEYEMNHLWKIQKERHLLENVLKQTGNELENGEYFAAKCLNGALSDFESLANVKLNIELKRNELRQTASELQADIRSMCLKNKEMETVEDDILFEDEILLDETIECKAKERYVERWENTRIFQNQLRLKDKEDGLRNAIRRQLKYSDLINRANDAMNSFRMTESTKLKDECDIWTKRFNKEIEELELELLKLNNEKESIENELKAIAMKYQEESQGIDEFKAFLEKIEDEKQKIWLQNDAASKIQRWWLGYKSLKEQLHPPKVHKQKNDKKKKKQHRASEDAQYAQN